MCVSEGRMTLRYLYVSRVEQLSRLRLQRGWWRRSSKPDVPDYRTVQRYTSAYTTINLVRYVVALACGFFTR